MGCGKSRPPASTIPPAVSENRGPARVFNRYDELAAAVISFREPSTEEVDFISRCNLSALEPRDPTKPPLLALAKDHDEWFRCLLRKCDPTVTWNQGREERSLRTDLIGHRNHDVWCDAKEKWERTHANKDSSGVTRAHQWTNERWWAEFGTVSVALGIAAAAAGNVATASFPVVAVGHVIWTVIKNWYTSFEKSGPAGDLNAIFSMHANVVGSILKELNTRIEVAEEAVRANPGDLKAKDESARQKTRVEGLRCLLKDDTEKMDGMLSWSSRASDKTKYDQMMTMLRGLLDFQRRLHHELMEERMSDSLKTAVSLLANIEAHIEELRGGSVSLSQSNYSRTRSPHMDSCQTHGGPPTRTRRNHSSSPSSSTVGTAGQSGAGGARFCEACSSSLPSSS